MDFPKVTTRPRPDPSYIRGSITLRDLVERFPLDSVISSKVYETEDYLLPDTAICIIPPDAGKAWIAEQFKRIQSTPIKRRRYIHTTATVYYLDELDLDFDGGKW